MAVSLNYCTPLYLSLKLCNRFNRQKQENDKIKFWKSGPSHLCIGESPRICPFLKNNGHEAPKGPSAIIFQEWTDTRTFSYLKYTLIYNYV